MKIPGDGSFRDSAFHHSSDIRKGRLENIVGPDTLSTTIPRTSRLFRRVDCSRSHARLARPSFYSGSCLINRFGVQPPPS